MKKWMIIPVLAIMSGLSGCQHKDTGFAFTSQRQYRHHLFTGGYEFIKFKPDGTVYAEIRHQGINAKTNGEYYYRVDGHGAYNIYVSLENGPRRIIKFSRVPHFLLHDWEKGQTWKLHRVLRPEENKLM